MYIHFYTLTYIHTHSHTLMYMCIQATSEIKYAGNAFTMKLSAGRQSAACPTICALNSTFVALPSLRSSLRKLTPAAEVSRATSSRGSCICVR